MHRIKFGFALFLLTALASSAQLRSPDDFLGYKVGSRYTPHWKIMNYFNHVATNAPAMVKLQPYGQTNEGRPLMVAFVSAADNITNLDNIRKNNLRLAGMMNDKMAASENTPTIIWLSYNVHGNETSSSEAAMMVLYALADPSNAKTKEWLKNTVVVIDPCINPDGRDRYVNWFNSIVGKDMNPQRIAREHREPWPGGRTNHYNFDLNRDWAWQTQAESQQRIKLYNQWMPQVHVDYHEQGINNPYYFAPAAQPFHEVLTPWQRDFQVTIGKNNAKYFDQNGWVFFTKEVFDLFYPSYGDTYPMYNGAIGMTYEQGGIGAGLGVINDEGDTLTLADRAIHHFTTSLSTIEISSLNAGRLVKEFHKYFSDVITAGAGEYKTFVIKYSDAAAERIDMLKKLLASNAIQYEVMMGSTRGMQTGFSYQTAREEMFTLDQGDLLISTQQPKGVLAKVLFEPQSKLVDSATYDITAWAVPYAYGLKAFASKSNLARGFTADNSGVPNSRKETSYGYVLPWKGVQTVKTVCQLLKKGILLRYAEEPFEVDGNKFDHGAIIILKTANRSFGQNLWNTVNDIAAAGGTQLYPVSSGFVDKGNDFGSDKVHPFKAPKVVLLTGEGVGGNSAGEIWHFFEQQIDYPVTLINVNDISRANWNDIDVLIMPDGNYKFLNDKESLAAFKDWISKGGRVVALEGAVAQLAKADFAIRQKKTGDDKDDKKDKAGYDLLKSFEDRDRDAISSTTPGSIWKVTLDNTNPLAYGYPDHYYTLKQDDVVYEFMKEGWNVGVIKKENQVAGFVGAELQPKLKDGLLFGVEYMGNGAISYLADDVMFRSFWENGKLMFCNAVFLVGK